uniref:Uncharacterized protein n=1 Tax=Octopus bimaculoides TaxID=37653 RepID=A0A0L8FLR2_OCTBM
MSYKCRQSVPTHESFQATTKGFSKWHKTFETFSFSIYQNVMNMFSIQTRSAYDISPYHGTHM